MTKWQKLIFLGTIIFLLLCSAILAFFKSSNPPSALDEGQLVDLGSWPAVTAGQVGLATWKARYTLARSYSTDHSRASFLSLLSLLRDPHPDVSYAAAESLEARKDVIFIRDFLQVISTIPRDRRWPLYHALGAYATEETRVFLTNSLREELDDFRSRKYFDDGNCLYIIRSIARIECKPDPTVGWNHAITQEQRVEEYKRILAAHSSQ